MVNRRQVLIGMGAVGAVSVAGCMDILQDGVEAEAQLAKLDEAVARENGYDEIGVDEYVVDETLEIAGESRDIHVTSWVVGYSKDTSDLEMKDQGDVDEFEGEMEDFLEQDGAGYAVISTPSESIAGQEVNPVGRMDDTELIEEFNEDLAEGEIKDIEHVNEYATEVLGEDTTTNEFEAVVETEDGETFDVIVYVTEVTNEDDIILGVGVHPAIADEQETSLELTESITHPVENDVEPENESD